MHRTRLLVLLSGLLLVASLCLAQTVMLDLPRQSQHAVVTQRIGITDITVNYHRPLVNSRQIWGKVVPYGEVWRAGANENTTVTFTDPVTIEGQPLDKGTYGLHMIPGENQWTVIFSKMSTAWGSFSYKQDEDALRVTVKPQTAEFHNALTYDFDDVKPDSTVVTLRWDKVAVPFKVAVKVNDIVEASIPRQMRGLNQYYWESWDDVANYFLTSKTNLDEALKDEEQSIQTEERFDNLTEQVADSRGHGPQRRRDEFPQQGDREGARSNFTSMAASFREKRNRKRPSRFIAPMRRSSPSNGRRTSVWPAFIAARATSTKPSRKCRPRSPAPDMPTDPIWKNT